MHLFLHKHDLICIIIFSFFFSLISIRIFERRRLQHFIFFRPIAYLIKYARMLYDSRGDLYIFNCNSLYFRINCEITTITYGDDQYAILINGPSSQEHILIYLIRHTVCLCIISDMYTKIVQLNNILSICVKFYIEYENISRSGSCIFVAVRGLLHACRCVYSCLRQSVVIISPVPNVCFSNTYSSAASL